MLLLFYGARQVTLWFYEHREYSLIPHSGIDSFLSPVMLSLTKGVGEKHLGHLILLWMIHEHKTINVYLLSVITVISHINAHG